MITSHNRIHALRDNLALLGSIQRGVEKEGLRVDPHGNLARTGHPISLGSALTNSHITTDYAEALLELITAPHPSVEALMTELHDIHSFTAQAIGDEIIWNQSMPAHLPAEADIQIGWYGTSNSGMLKHIYRRGLAERYGKYMQCIAGVHYNFSVPDDLWPLLAIGGRDANEQRSEGYLALIRNFTRYSWLLMYLFGASPAVSSSFLNDQALPLERIAEDTYALPWATSLRMSDLGYQNKEAQAELQLCYNDLDTLLMRMCHAATTPWPDYEKIGTHRDGEWIQLNNNILQIENEYYSNIRPKRTTLEGERPATALKSRGVEYVEVRCLDIDPYSPIGISAETCRFLDTFLLFCAVEHSAFFPDNGFCQDSKRNFAKVVTEGRKPGLILRNPNKKDVSLQEWGADILEAIQPYAKLFDEYHQHSLHSEALALQKKKLANPDLTPSGRLLNELTSSGACFNRFSLTQSKASTEQLKAYPLGADQFERYTQAAADSIAAQAALEAEDEQSFDEFLKHFEALL